MLCQVLSPPGRGCDLTAILLPFLGPRLQNGQQSRLVPGVISGTRPFPVRSRRDKACPHRVLMNVLQLRAHHFLTPNRNPVITRHPDSALDTSIRSDLLAGVFLEVTHHSRELSSVGKYNQMDVARHQCISSEPGSVFVETKPQRLNKVFVEARTVAMRPPVAKRRSHKEAFAMVLRWETQAHGSKISVRQCRTRDIEAGRSQSGLRNKPSCVSSQDFVAKHSVCPPHLAGSRSARTIRRSKVDSKMLRQVLAGRVLCCGSVT